MSERLRDAQIVRAAELYYRQQLSQQQIAKILGCSHSTVSRLLSEARETGVVEIKIRRGIETVPELANRIRSAFKLREAIVVPGAGVEEANLKAVGTAAANLLLSIVTDGQSIGVTWGNTLYQMVNALDDLPLDGIEVVQLTGALGGKGDPEVDGPKLAIRLAERFSGTCCLVPAPAIVKDTAMRDTLMQEPAVEHALKRAANVDIIVQGIGALSGAQSSLRRAGYIRKSDQREMKANGAVGHIAARMIDADGRELTEFARQVISVPLASMRKAKWSICISASPAKVPALLAGLRGGYMNAIVVDDESALQMLQLREVTAA